MAWLETKVDVYRIRFRYGGSKRLLALHTSDKKEAAESLARFEANVRLIERGIIDPPGEDVDLGVYIVSGGKLSSRPVQEARAERVTLASLFDSHLARFPREANEVRTWQTENTHIRLIRRLLDMQLSLTEVTPRVLQAYVDARAKEAGKRKKCVSRETVQKELGTFSAVWNKWGVPQGLTSVPAPVKNLTAGDSQGIVAV